MHYFRRTGAVLASAALAVSGVALTGTPAQAAPDTRPVSIGADWLAAQLVNGLQQSSFGGPDVGLSIDSGIALAAVGDHAADVTAIKDAVGPKVVETGEFDFGYAQSDEYAYPNGFDKPGVFEKVGHYAAGFAKSLYFAQSTGIADIPTWAGTNLQTGLEALVTPAGASAGRVHDDSSFGDFANTLTQAYTVKALTTAGSAAAESTLAFLLKQQCSAGFFRLNLTVDKAATDQTCDGGKAAGKSAADPDVTSEVVRLLLTVAEENPLVARRVGKAEAWLLGQQRADGSFVGGTSTAVPNANSTGLAGWALSLLGDDEAAARAAAWVRQHQADEVAGCTNGLTAETGAIGYDDAAVAKAVQGGVGTARPTWVRATSQALPVLNVLQTTTPSLDLTGPTGFVKGGRSTTYRVAGAVPGEKVCLTGGTTGVRAAANADGVATAAVPFTNVSANRTVVVKNRDGGTDAVSAKVLGPKVFKVVASRATVKRGGTVTVTVLGLAPGESVHLYARGKVVAGNATPTGAFVRVIAPGRTLGKVTVTVLGQYGDTRRGTTSFKVVK